jgi:hypothetical protein
LEDINSSKTTKFLLLVASSITLRTIALFSFSDTYPPFVVSATPYGVLYPDPYSPECLEVGFSEVRIPDPAYRSARATEVGRDDLRLLITLTCALLRGWIDMRLLG